MRIRTAIAASLLSAVLDLGLNVCGNTIVALLNPASQNACKAN
ncbi:chaplin family protein [Streptomyces sp. PU-14G]